MMTMDGTKQTSSMPGCWSPGASEFSRTETDNGVTVSEEETFPASPRQSVGLLHRSVALRWPSGPVEQRAIYAYRTTAVHDLSVSKRFSRKFCAFSCVGPPGVTEVQDYVPWPSCPIQGPCYPGTANLVKVCHGADSHPSPS